MSNENKEILLISPVHPGSTHDFSIFKKEKIGEILPIGKPVYTDTGFEGVEKEAPQANIRKPKKKRKNKKLNGGEKLGNRLISKERVKVEHAIGGIKRFKILSSTFRGIKISMIQNFEIMCGLWNLHVLRTLKTNAVAT